MNKRTFLKKLEIRFVAETELDVTLTVAIYIYKEYI